MTKEQISDSLAQSYQDLVDWFEDSNEKVWLKAPKNRWTAGQHMLHLYNSEKMINKALSYPSFLIRYKFGKSNRPSRSFQEVADRYIQKLNANRERARVFNQDLRIPDTDEKMEILNSFQKERKRMQQKTLRLKDKQLDTLLLPHPLMGRMTLRELLMWNSYHSSHHLEILKRDYI